MKTNPNRSAFLAETFFEGDEIKDEKTGVIQVKAMGWSMGLTKREYFAAVAMQGILSKVYGEYTDEEIESTGKTAHEFTALDAVRSADALIEELNNEENITTSS